MMSQSIKKAPSAKRNLLNPVFSEHIDLENSAVVQIKKISSTLDKKSPPQKIDEAFFARTSRKIGCAFPPYSFRSKTEFEMWLLPNRNNWFEQHSLPQTKDVVVCDFASREMEEKTLERIKIFATGQLGDHIATDKEVDALKKGSSYRPELPHAYSNATVQTFFKIAQRDGIPLRIHEESLLSHFDFIDKINETNLKSPQTSGALVSITAINPYDGVDAQSRALLLRQQISLAEELRKPPFTSLVSKNNSLRLPSISGKYSRQRRYLRNDPAAEILWEGFREMPVKIRKVEDHLVSFDAAQHNLPVIEKTTNGNLIIESNTKQDILQYIPSSQKLKCSSLSDLSETIVLDFATQKFQRDMLQRLYFFVEGPELPRSHVLTNEEADAASAGRFEWATTSNLAHDYRADHLRKFFAAADRDGICLNEDENWLRELAEAKGWLNSDVNGALISITAINETDSFEREDREEFLTHEISHAAYFTSPQYAQAVHSVWNKVLSENEKDIFRKKLGEANYDVSNEDVMINESHAYIAFTGKNIGWKSADVDLSEDRFETIRQAFAGCAKQIGLSNETAVSE